MPNLRKIIIGVLIAVGGMLLLKPLGKLLETYLGKKDFSLLMMILLVAIVLRFAHGSVARLKFDEIPKAESVRWWSMDLAYARPLKRKWLFAHFYIAYTLLGLAAARLALAPLTNG